MFGFILMLLIGLIGVGLIIGGFFVSRHLKNAPPSAHHDWEGSGSTDGRLISRVVCFVVGPILVVVSFLVIFFGMWLTSVPTQNVAVVTFGGRPVGYLTNGYHLVPPWDGVTLMDNQVNTDVLEGTCVPGSKNPGGVPVRIAGQQTACAQVRIVWQMRQNAADNLYRNYHDTDAVRTKLVDTELATAMNQQFDGYDPINSLTTTVKLGTAGNPTVPQVAQAVTTQMQQDIGDRIHIIHVLVPIINFDGTVQTQLNKVLAQKAATDVAIQAVQTANYQAQAANTLAHKAALTPAVLTQTCYNIVGEAMKVGYTLPATFNCTGSSGGVLVNTGK